MGWLRDSLGFSTTGGGSGVGLPTVTQSGTTAVDPMSGLYTGATPFAPAAAGAPTSGAGGAPTGGGGAMPPGTTPQQAQQYQYLTGTLGMSRQEAGLIVFGQPQPPSALATTAAGVAPTAGKILEADLAARRQRLAPLGAEHVSVQAPGPLQFGAQPEPMPATTTDAMIAQLL
jgi:hypothetical protein